MADADAPVFFTVVIALALAVLIATAVMEAIQNR